MDLINKNMTLIGAILNKVKSKESFVSKKKYPSPPPELDEADIERRIFKKKKKLVNKYPDVTARVDSSPPRLELTYMFRNLENWQKRASTLYIENFKLLTEIKRHHFLRGKVDCRWKFLPKPSMEYYEKRRNFLKRVQTDNKIIYKRIIESRPRVTPTESLKSDWRNHRRQMVERATRPFVLFPPLPKEDVDIVFVAPPGVKRPRVHMSLRIEGGASIGSLTMELFTDVCPQTCQLFTELVDGDEVGHGYVGTSFFRKVPYLYWSGGDVIYDNGFGCYAQVGKRVPIGAENYHFPHSMPGLLSMRMTANDEMCGIFNITFKPLPQFDLKNVVFGRVVRPSSTYDIISSFGSALSTHPIVRVASTRRRDGERWTSGRTNQRLKDLKIIKREKIY